MSTHHYILLALLWSPAMATESAPELPPGVRKVDHDPAAFRPDPTYENLPYDAKAQLQIYGGKHHVDTTRPLLELGRDFLTGGPIEPGLPVHFIVYGDLRLASGVNLEVPPVADQTTLPPTLGDPVQSGVAAVQLNLETDFKLTSTARLHFLLQPFQTNNQVTRFQFLDGDAPGRDRDETLRFAFQPCFDSDVGECDNALDVVDEFGTLFFEGDLGAMLGIDADLPFAFGKIPVIFQNGLWVEDAFLGAAFTIPARNSPGLNISNLDVTFFAGFDGIDTVAQSADGSPLVFGTNWFIEANLGYWELGYGFLLDPNGDDGSFHGVMLAFTRRYGGWLSNSVRLIGELPVDSAADSQGASGAVLLLENSFVTSSPLTLVPYLNLFVGLDRPQPLARAANAGLLKNTGLAFEGDAALTKLPAMEDDPADGLGGAFGLEYLFALDQQLVVEGAVALGLCSAGETTSFGNDCRRINALGAALPLDQAGAALRYQFHFAGWMILRFDLTFVRDEPFGRGDGAAQNRGGARVELRTKF